MKIKKHSNSIAQKTRTPETLTEAFKINIVPNLAFRMVGKANFPAQKLFSVIYAGKYQSTSTYQNMYLKDWKSWEDYTGFSHVKFGWCRFSDKKLIL